MAFYWVTREYDSPELLVSCQSFGVKRLSLYIYTYKGAREPLAIFSGLCMFLAYNGQTTTDCGVICSPVLYVDVICKKHWMFALIFFQVVYKYSFRKAPVFTLNVVEPLSHVKILIFRLYLKELKLT